VSRRPPDRVVDALEASPGEPATAEDVQRLRRSLDEEGQRHLRLLADLENVRRRAAHDQAMARQSGERAALLPLLPVVDNLERALAAGSTDRDFYEGVAATYRLLLAALREAGAEPLESVGHPFDPNVHEAVAIAPSDAVAPGTVEREAQRGWRLGKDLLRPAQVVVATSPEASDPWR